MTAFTDLIVHFGDVIELNLPTWDVTNAVKILEKHPGWQLYNPRKVSIPRYGLSVTSLDGGFSGEPDLDSLKEYNKEHGTAYTEFDFKSRTNITKYIPELNQLLDFFPYHGRCHFLRFDAGGYFPPHRDNGTSSVLPTSLRILVPICNFYSPNLYWIQDGSPVNFTQGRTYFVNTTKVHSIFSYCDMSCCFVMNVEANQQSIQKIISNLQVS